jgi:NADPH:quinone reductase-like Zn-dependent oxidoreductase
MTGIALNGKGGPEVLQPTSMPVPQVGHGQILVKVAAAGVNRPDVQQRMGASRCCRHRRHALEGRR